MRDTKHISNLIIVNTMLVSFVVSAWWANYFAGFMQLHISEYAMIIFLFSYFIFGVCASILKKWYVVRHIANGLPMWSLVFTGIGIINAAIGLVNIETETLVLVFKKLALAISPNVIGVFLMIWLREIALWCGHEET